MARERLRERELRAGALRMIGCMRIAASLVLLAILGACAPLPQRAGIPSEWIPSPNHNERRPNFVIIHHTGSDDVDRSLRTLTRRHGSVSAHYLIGRDGTIRQLVDERARAWHAGQSYWGGDTDMNSASIGVEVDNDGNEPFSDAEIAALLALLQDVTTRNAIPRANILGHGDVAPGRKVDPSRHFPWRRLAERGFGLWCESNDAAAAPSTPTADAQAEEEATLLLQAIGYDVRDHRAAIGAFRRHFRHDDSDTLTADDLPLLRCLARAKPEQASTPRP